MSSHTSTIFIFLNIWECLLFWVFIGRTDAEAETPILWPPHGKSWLIGKDSDAGRDWGQEEKGTTEDEMAGWHHQLDGHEFEWTPGVGDGQGSLACYDSWSCKESDTTEWLNWTIIMEFSRDRNIGNPILCNIYMVKAKRENENQKYNHRDYGIIVCWL